MTIEVALCDGYERVQSRLNLVLYNRTEWEFLTLFYLFGGYFVFMWHHRLWHFTFSAQSQKGKKCTQAQKALEPIHLSYGECVSVRLYRPNYCGVCTDGRCCSPRRTRTVPVTFVCPDGERFQKSAMFIQSCKCSSDCGHLNEVALPPQHWMYGDTHNFTD